MRIIRGIALLVISLVIMGNGVMAAETTERTASVVTFEGEISILNAGAEKSEPPYEGLSLDQGTRIITGKDASIVLLIDTDKEVIIGEKSYVTIEELTLEEGKEKTGFRLLAGKLWSSIKKKLNVGESYEIRTPNAIMGARGTKFSVSYQEDFEPGDGQALSKQKTDLTVVEGVVAARLKTSGKPSEEQEASMDVKQGEKLALDQDKMDEQTLEVEAIDYETMDLFTIDAILEDIEGNPDDYDEVLKLKETLEELRPLVEERENLAFVEVKPLIGNIVYERTSTPPVVATTTTTTTTSTTSSSTTEEDGETSSSESEIVEVTGLTLDQSTLTLELGEGTKTLSVEVTPSDASDKNVTWDSSDKSVATVDGNGVVTPQAIGSTEIMVKSDDGGFTASCQVTVVEKSVTAISLFDETLELYKGEEANLWYSITPTDAGNKNVTWATGAPEVVAVDEGLITGLNIGTSIITVTTDDGSFTATCTVNVSAVPVESVNILEEAIGLDQGAEQELSYEILPGEAEDQSVTWASSNSDYVTVDAFGKVKAIVTTDEAITITLSMAGGFTDTCHVSVDPIPVTGVVLDQTEVGLDLDATGSLVATVLPAEASIKNLVWTSDDRSIASVDAKTGTITAVNVGTTTVWVTTIDGNKTAQCEVTVLPIPLVSITLSENSLTLDPEETQLLTASLLPINSTYKALQWISSNEDVVRVEEGLISAVGAGTATITAKSINNPEITALCDVTVNSIAVEGITISDTSISLDLEGAWPLSAQVTPENAANQGISWSSDNVSIASVDQEGVVTAKGEGTTTIHVTTDEGNKTASCTVLVGFVAVESVEISGPSLSVAQGEDIQLTAKVLPENASTQGITWSISDNPSVAFIDDTGKVHGNAKGEVTITATSDDGNYTADFDLYVVVKVFDWVIKSVEAKDENDDGYVDELIIDTYKDILAFDYTKPLVHEDFGTMTLTEEDVDIDGKKITIQIPEKAYYGTGDFALLEITSDRIIYKNQEIYFWLWDTYTIEEDLRPIVEAAVKVRDEDSNRADQLDLSFSENIYYYPSDGFEIDHFDKDEDEGEIVSFKSVNGNLRLELEDCRLGDILEVKDKNHDEGDNKLVKAKFELQRDLDGNLYWVKLED